MKKILLLIVSGLLLACMAGSAMADPCIVTMGKTLFKIPVGSEDSTTVTVDRYTIIGDRTISVWTSNPSVEATLNETEMGWANDTMKNMNYKITSTNAVNTFTLRVRASGSGSNYQGYVYVHANEGNVYLPYGTTGVIGVDRAGDPGAGSGSASIPEFPTLALPVAGILGLLFIFGRKKEGL